MENRFSCKDCFMVLLPRCDVTVYFFFFFFLLWLASYSRSNAWRERKRSHTRRSIVVCMPAVRLLLLSCLRDFVKFFPFARDFRESIRVKEPRRKRNRTCSCERTFRACGTHTAETASAEDLRVAWQSTHYNATERPRKEGWEAERERGEERAWKWSPRGRGFIWLQHDVFFLSPLFFSLPRA